MYGDNVDDYAFNADTNYVIEDAIDDSDYGNLSDNDYEEDVNNDDHTNYANDAIFGIDVDTLDIDSLSGDLKEILGTLEHFRKEPTENIYKIKENVVELQNKNNRICRKSIILKTLLDTVNKEIIECEAILIQKQEKEGFFEEKVEESSTSKIGVKDNYDIIMNKLSDKKVEDNYDVIMNKLSNKNVEDGYGGIMSKSNNKQSYSKEQKYNNNKSYFSKQNEKIKESPPFYELLKQKLDNILTVLVMFKDSDGLEPISQINKEVEMLSLKYEHVIKREHDLQIYITKIDYHISIIAQRIKEKSYEPFLNTSSYSNEQEYDKHLPKLSLSSKEPEYIPYPKLSLYPENNKMSYSKGPEYGNNFNEEPYLKKSRMENRYVSQYTSLHISENEFDDRCASLDVVYNKKEENEFQNFIDKHENNVKNSKNTK